MSDQADPVLRVPLTECKPPLNYNPDHPDAELIGAGAHLRRFIWAYDLTNDEFDGEVWGHAYDTVKAAVDLVREAGPATTPAGVLTKLEAFERHVRNELDEKDQSFLNGIIGDLERIVTPAGDGARISKGICTKPGSCFACDLRCSRHAEGIEQMERYLAVARETDPDVTMETIDMEKVVGIMEAREQGEAA